jgi:hypothetical protein
MNKTDKQHAEKMRAALEGRKIVDVRYMTKKEADHWGWYNRPVVIRLDDNTFLLPMRDDEGNDGGAIHCTAVEHGGYTIR